MSTETKIEWCDHTFNPWRGCTAISEGCEHCYAASIAKRNQAVLGRWGCNGTRVVASESYWNLPLKWDAAAAKSGRRARVFCASMADFHERLPSWPALQIARERTCRMIECCRNLDWLILTKRPENVWAQWPENWRWDGPPNNLWLGVTGENQRRLDDRLEAMDILAVETRFVSIEPLLERVSLFDQRIETHPDWVIVGCESGPRRRPFQLSWAHSIVEQCLARGVPVFVKQLPAESVHCTAPSAGVCRHVWHFPPALRVQEWPCKSSLHHKTHP